MSSQNNEDAALRHREYSPLGNGNPYATFDMKWIGQTPTIRERREYMEAYFKHIVGPKNINHGAPFSLLVASQKAASKELVRAGVSQCLTSYFEWRVDFYRWHFFFNSIQGARVEPATWPWPTAPVADLDEQLSTTFETYRAKILEEVRCSNTVRTILDSSDHTAAMDEDVSQESQSYREKHSQTPTTHLDEIPSTTDSPLYKSQSPDGDATEGEVGLLQTRLFDMENELLATQMKHSQAIAMLETQLTQSFASTRRLKDDAEMRSADSLEQIASLRLENADLRDQLSRSIRCHNEVQRLYESLTNADGCEAEPGNVTEDVLQRTRDDRDHDEEMRTLHESLRQSQGVRCEMEAKLVAAQSQETLADAIYDRMQRNLQAAVEHEATQSKIKCLELDLAKAREEARAAKQDAQDALGQAHEHQCLEAETRASLNHNKEDLESSLKIVARLSIENDSLCRRIQGMQGEISEQSHQQETLLNELGEERALTGTLRASLADFAVEQPGKKRRRLLAPTEEHSPSPEHKSSIAWSDAQFYFAITAMSDLSEIAKVADHFRKNPNHESRFERFLEFGKPDEWFSFGEVRRKGAKAIHTCDPGEGCCAHQDGFHVMVTTEGSQKRLLFQ